MVSLEKIIRESAKETDPVVDLSGTRYRDKKDNRLLRIDDVSSIPYVFSQIDLGDRNTSRTVFIEYLKLEHNADITGKSLSEKPGRSRTKEENFFTFFNSYMRVYDSGLGKKKRLFNEGMLKAVEYANVPTSLSPVFQLYGELLKFDIGLIEIWNKSLDCVTQEPKGVAKNQDQRLRRYLKMSEDRLQDYHPSFRFIFDVMGKKSDLKSSLFGVEDFLFDISKSNDLGEASVQDYYRVMSGFPASVRTGIESIRGKLHSNDLDNVLYGLFAIPRHNRDTRIDLAHFLRDYTNQHEDTKDILDLAPTISQVVKDDPRLSRKALRFAGNLLSLEAYKEKSVVKPYLETVASIPVSIDDPDERFFNTRLAAQLFRDYVLRDDYNIGNVVERYNSCSRELSKLDGEDKKIATNALSNLMDNIEREGRLVPDNSILIDEVFGSITRSFSIDSQKSRDFVNAVVEYEREKTW